MSFQQSVFHGVPLIIMPFWNDQIYNARSSSKRGFGIHLEISEMTEESLTGAVNELLNNPK